MSKRYNQDYVSTFKAGDFTSGKMGEIFKTCFMDGRTVIINHKVFGECYLLPKSDLMESLNLGLYAFFGFEIIETDKGFAVSRDDRKGLLYGSELFLEYRDALKTAFDTNFEGMMTDSDAFRLAGRVVNALHAHDMRELKDDKNSKD